MLLPYDVRADAVGWTVFDVTTGRPVAFEGASLVGLAREDATVLVNALNRPVHDAEPARPPVRATLFYRHPRSVRAGGNETPAP